MRASSPSSLTASRIPSAARIARSASSSCACATPKAARTASPANFSTIPPCVVTQCVTWSKNRVTRRRTTSGIGGGDERRRIDEIDEQDRCKLALHRLKCTKADMPRPADRDLGIRPCSTPTCSRHTTSAGSTGAELDEDGAQAIGRAYVEQFEPRRIAVGRDMRLSSPSMAAAVIEGAPTAGADVLDIGLVGTEMVYFAVGELGLDGGIMVTASHNPKEYTGMKIVRARRAARRRRLGPFGRARPGDGRGSVR